MNRVHLFKENFVGAFKTICKLIPRMFIFFIPFINMFFINYKELVDDNNEYFTFDG